MTNIIDYQRAKILIVWFCMTGHTYSASPTSIEKEITCYMCVSPQITATSLDEEFKDFPISEVDSIPNCGSIEADNFTLKCPEIYKGCVTKYYGKHQKILLKSCSELSITDCGIANKIKYCFCSGTLCNDVKIPQTTTIITDDEDLYQSTEEGSGSLDWRQYDTYKYSRKQFNTSTVIKANKLNNTFKENENHSFTKGSAVQLFPSRNIYVISVILLIYKVV